ncbi:MAG: hypothetical protein LBF54_04595 [Holosporaceae bacterium]|jgi:hypothetical protein|nr:hypothetical protein [Holosporaceae bacterium]
MTALALGCALVVDSGFCMEDSSQIQAGQDFPVQDISAFDTRHQSPDVTAIVEKSEKALAACAETLATPNAYLDQSGVTCQEICDEYAALAAEPAPEPTDPDYDETLKVNSRFDGTARKYHKKSSYFWGQI